MYPKPLHFSDMLEFSMSSKTNSSILSICLDWICPVNQVNKKKRLYSELFIKQLPFLPINLFYTNLSINIYVAYLVLWDKKSIHCNYLSLFFVLYWGVAISHMIPILLHDRMSIIFITKNFQGKYSLHWNPNSLSTTSHACKFEFSSTNPFEGGFK